MFREVPTKPDREENEMSLSLILCGTVLRFTLRFPQVVPLNVRGREDGSVPGDVVLHQSLGLVDGEVASVLVKDGQS